MKREEAEEMLVIIEATYPMFMNGRPEVLKKRVEIWLYRLMDMDHEKAMKNLNNYINENEYPPTISDIKPFEYEFDSVMAKVNKVMKKDNEDDN